MQRDNWRSYATAIISQVATESRALNFNRDATPQMLDVTLLCRFTLFGNAYTCSTELEFRNFAERIKLRVGKAVSG